MGFELLEGFERMNIGIGVVEPYHITHGHKVVLCKVVAKAATVSFCVLKKRVGELKHCIALDALHCLV